VKSSQADELLGIKILTSTGKTEKTKNFNFIFYLFNHALPSFIDPGKFVPCDIGLSGSTQGNGSPKILFSQRSLQIVSLLSMTQTIFFSHTNIMWVCFHRFQVNSKPTSLYLVISGLFEEVCSENFLGEVFVLNFFKIFHAKTFWDKCHTLRDGQGGWSNYLLDQFHVDRFLWNPKTKVLRKNSRNSPFPLSWVDYNRLRDMETFERVPLFSIQYFLNAW
jgi:hypothetical protein